MLATPPDVLRARAQELSAGQVPRDRKPCALGGGTTPTETIPSVAIEVPGNAERAQKRLLQMTRRSLAGSSTTVHHRGAHAKRTEIGGLWLRRSVDQTVDVILPA